MKPSVVSATAIKKIMKKKLFKNILLAMAGTLLFSLVLIILVLNQNFAEIETGRLSSQANMVQAGI